LDRKRHRILIIFVSYWPSKNKEEMMRKFISIIVVFMLMFILIGCATMSLEEPKGTFDPYAMQRRYWSGLM
jgi:hypothetical protein